MDYSKLCKNDWAKLEEYRNEEVGYQSTWIGIHDNISSDLHIFRDNDGRYHFALLTTDRQSSIKDPNINGLKISFAHYNLSTGKTQKFIDVECGFAGYLEEFTHIVKEICKHIFEKGYSYSDAVSEVISSWRQFWENRNTLILSDEQQIGLFCELNVLNRLCVINQNSAISSWAGPLAQRHDFNFSEWTFEVKGTRRSYHGHTINGIDQLQAELNKSLAFISFRVAISQSANAISLPGLIEHIRATHFENNIALQIRFNELLALAGYSPIFANDYQNSKIEILEEKMFAVDHNFPKLTSDNLKAPLNSRVNAIRYNIDLGGISGIDLSDVNWGNYFY